METGKKPRSITLITTILAVFIFLVSGILSTYLYFILSDKGGAIFPGLLYTSATVLLFVLLGIPFTSRNLTIYYTLMFLTYLFIWAITMVSSWFGFIIGIITAGMGSMMTFYITNMYILPISYKRNTVFAWGALAFFLTDIVYWSWPGGDSFVCNLLRIEPEPAMLFGEVFFFWHILVGMTLLQVLRKKLTKP